MHDKELLLTAINAAIMAGQQICNVYNSSDFHIEMKQDNSPLTLADRLSHKTITEQLQITNLPVLSEEGKDIPFEERQKWETFWLVDPLDGTKEFIKQNGEFTVNIALIQGQYPIAGVIYVPVKKQLFFASQQLGSFKTGHIEQIVESVDLLLSNSQKLPSTFPQGGYVIVASRSHINEQTQDYIDQKAAQCDDFRIENIGSSLKFCLIAEGIAHEYPRFGPTMEWDTAAGHAIVKFTGGTVVVHPDGQELHYNKPDLHNPFFIVRSSFLMNE